MLLRASVQTPGRPSELGSHAQEPDVSTGHHTICKGRTERQSIGQIAQPSTETVTNIRQAPTTLRQGPAELERPRSARVARRSSSFAASAPMT